MERSSEDGAAAGGRPTSAARGAGRNDPGAADTDADPDAGPGHWLQRTIETEILPRLMLVHRSATGRPPLDLTSTLDAAALDAVDVDAFARMLLRDEPEAIAAFVDALRERGTSLERIHLGLIAPAARRLGTMWENDECDFAQVTLGVWRLQNLVLDLSPQLPADRGGRPGASRRALLAAVPGSQHTLGLLIVAERFRHAGWQVWSDPCATEADLVALVRSEWFDVFGLSVGGDVLVAPARSVILAMRAASRNPAATLMLGGPLASLRPGLADEVGADFSASDVSAALERVDSLSAMRASPS